MNELLKQETINIENMIYEIRGKQVMFASDIAKLYHSETKVINQVVKRNIKRFPLDFCFQLTREECELYSRSQFVTLNKNGNKQGYNLKYLPYVFTEHGIIMLSSLLKSDIAVKVNVMVVKAFVAMKKYIGSNLIEQRYINNLVLEHDENIKLLQESFSKLEEKKKINEIYFNGQIYDAYSKIIDIMKEAKKELIIIDRYADKSVLDMISKVDVKVNLITKRNGSLSKLDIEKYQKQYDNLNVMYDDTFHDRYIIVDKKIFYHLGASVNHAGSRTFSINILEDEIVKNLLLEKIEIKNE